MVALYTFHTFLKLLPENLHTKKKIMKFIIRNVNPAFYLV
jgi:hypothetical protein